LICSVLLLKNEFLLFKIDCIVGSLRRFNSLPKKAKKRLEQLYGTDHRLVESKYQKPRVTEELFEPPKTRKDTTNTETKEAIMGKY
jgi:hypothetical protein